MAEKLLEHGANNFLAALHISPNEKYGMAFLDISTGEFFVAEGDESDGTLEYFSPEHSLILNIEEEHLDFYADLKAIEKVFTTLIERTKGAVFYSADDSNAQPGPRSRESLYTSLVNTARHALTRLEASLSESQRPAHDELADYIRENYGDE